VLLEGNDALRAARLSLTDATRITLASGLALLGVPTPEGM
jgi:arginyl-tRNA synthetase